MGKNKYFGATKKVSLFPIILAVFCCAITLTIAFFFSGDFASGYLGISGKVEIIAVGKGDEYNSIENSVSSSNLVIELDQNRDTLIPGMPLRIDVNCKVKRSTTKPLLRAWLSLDLYDVETMEKIDDWGEDAGVIIDINNQLDDIITGNSKWVLHDDGFYYYVNSIDSTNTGDSILQEIDATAGDVIVPFIDKEIKFPTSVDSTYSGFGVKIRVTFQAIQNYIPDDNGQKLPNTIDNSYKIFNGFGSMYEPTPISMFDTVENWDGTIIIKAKAGVTYPSTINLPTHTADGKPITKIAADAFRNNKNITNVYIPYTYTEIGGDAFRSSSVLNVDARDSKLEKLDPRAFYWSSLTSIKLPNTLKTIENSAFDNCKLHAIEIPASVENIDDNAFSYYNYSILERIKVDENNANYYDVDEHSLVSKDGKLILVTNGYTNYEYTLDDNITELGSASFYNNKNITTLNLNSQIETLDYIVTMANKFTTISYVNIGNNPNFEILTDENGNKILIKKNTTNAILITLSNDANKLNIVDTITAVNYDAIRPASNRAYITELIVGSGLQDAENIYKLGQNKQIELIYFTVSALNNHLQTVTSKELISKDGKTFYWYAAKNSATTYSIPTGVKTIKYFGQVYNLNKLDMSTEVTKICANVFWTTSYNALFDITVSGVIENEQFGYGSRLHSITLLETVTSIGASFVPYAAASLQWVEFQSTTVPTINTQGFLNAVKNKSSFVIYVPDACVDAYKSATAFANFVDRIKPVSERPSA